MYTAVQGIGGGAISFLSMTLVSDLVPLNERGLYQGIISLTWAFASGVGPPIVRLPRMLSFFQSSCTNKVYYRYRREARLRKKRRGAGFSVRTEREFWQKPILTDALDLNLPVTGIAFTLVFFFLSVKTPEGSITAKLKRVDWV